MDAPQGRSAVSADEAPPRGMGRGDGLRGGEERVGISSVMTSWGCSDMPYARKIMCVPYRERVYRHTEMIYSMCVLMCVTHRGRVCSMLVAGQVLSLLLVTTGGTSALLVGRGLEAPTFVALCTYIMLSLFYGGSLLFSARYVGWEIFVCAVLYQIARMFLQRVYTHAHIQTTPWRTVAVGVTCECAAGGKFSQFPINLAI